MSGLAKLFMKNQAIVTGSDQSDSPVVDKLRLLGADILSGHHPDNIGDDVNAVVISAAISQDNPELKFARQKGCEVYKYAEMLGAIMNSYSGIAFCGTHGKSTASGWLTVVLKNAGLDPSFIIGADISQIGSSSGAGTGRYFVAEACEYDRSFLNLRPKIAVMLNIEPDHLDYYKDEQEIVDAFTEFASRLPDDGILIANAQDANVTKVVSRVKDRLKCQLFGLNPECTFSAQNISLINGLYEFDLCHNGQTIGRTRLPLPGEHNILNALAVAAVAINAGVPGKRTVELLGNFKGMDRRLMFKARLAEITVLDDYAHHPTEIMASLKAIRERFAPARLFCVFQPHQYSRTRFLLDDFAESFKLADVTVAPEIYFVRDTRQAKKQVNSQVLVERICANGSEAVFIDSFEGICDYLKKNILPGDLVVTMGAGDIWKVADEYIRWLRENC